MRPQKPETKKMPQSAVDCQALMPAGELGERIAAF
jgi:hypothetical protein